MGNRCIWPGLAGPLGGLLHRGCGHLRHSLLLGGGGAVTSLLHPPTYPDERPLAALLTCRRPRELSPVVGAIAPSPGNISGQGRAATRSNHVATARSSPIRCDHDHQWSRSLPVGVAFGSTRRVHGGNMKRGSIKDPLLAAAPRASSCLHRQACTQPFQQPPRAAPRAVRPVRAPTVYTAVCDFILAACGI